MSMMYLQDRSNTYALGYFPQTDPIQQWSAQRAVETAARLRLPAVFAAQRLGLSSRRCNQLQEQIDETRRRLLNIPNQFDASDVSGIEKRLLDLEDKLHKERLDLWKDLLPLAETARDAGVEAARHAWLSEFTRLVGQNGDRQ